MSYIEQEIDMSNTKLNQLIDRLNQGQLSNSDKLNIDKLAGDGSVACITVPDREEFPIYLTVDEGQILVITYLFADDQVKSAQKSNLTEAMLILNVSIPLSAFSKISNQYIMFGALSPQSSTDDLIKEIETLSDNVLEAIDAVSEYLT